MTNQEIIEQSLRSANRKVDHFQTQIDCFHRVFKNKTPSSDNLKELEASQRLLDLAKKDYDRIASLLDNK